MQLATQSATSSRWMLWTGRAISALVVLFMIFDAGIKVMRLAPAVEGTAQLGYPLSQVQAIGIVLLACMVLYVIPRTSVLGAILLTGYLGGAVASQLRIEAPLFSNILFPVYFGVLVWGGLYLRDGRLRAIIPLRS